MNIVIKWFVCKKIDLYSMKTWKFSTDNFNHETPKVGDSLTLDLPISKVSHLDPEMNYWSNFWSFKIIRREWTPLSCKNQSVILEVELEDIQRFLDLSRSVREELKKVIDEEYETLMQEEF